MRFLRSLLGRGTGTTEGTLTSGPPAGAGSAESAAPPDQSSAAGGDGTLGGDDLPDDDAARDARLQRDFQAGLSDLARRQLQFAAYATVPPSQVNRSGTWYLTEVTQARDLDGRAIVLDEKTALEFVAGDQGTPTGDEGMRAGDVRTHDGGAARSLRFRLRDGRVVELDVPPDEDWPALLVRESNLGPGSSSGV